MSYHKFSWEVPATCNSVRHFICILSVWTDESYYGPSVPRRYHTGSSAHTSLRRHNETKIRWARRADNASGIAHSGLAHSISSAGNLDSYHISVKTGESCRCFCTVVQVQGGSPGCSSLREDGQSMHSVLDPYRSSRDHKWNVQFQLSPLRLLRTQLAGYHATTESLLCDYLYYLKPRQEA